MLPYPKLQVLLFNIRKDERCEKLTAWLEASGVTVRHVSPSDFGRPLGFLLGLPGFDSGPNAPFFGFSDEMLLMCGFDRQRLNELLRFFEREKLRRIELKAMLTPTNAAWDAVELHRRLSAERKHFASMKKRS